MMAAQSQAQGEQSALAEFLTAEKIFDARWAMTVLAGALKRLRQEYATTGQTSRFEALIATGGGLGP
jgi:hypothetical protein